MKQRCFRFVASVWLSETTGWIDTTRTIQVEIIYFPYLLYEKQPLNRFQRYGKCKCLFGTSEIGVRVFRNKRGNE